MDHLTAYQKVQLARHPHRPYFLDYVEHLCPDFTEVHGDRKFADDPAIVAGFGIRALQTLMGDLIVERMHHRSPLWADGEISNHPATPGYVDSIARRFRDCSRIEFRGYVAEDDIPELFRTASVLVMPYNSATGASGVAHLACQYGLPIISADIADFREMADDESLAISFFQVGDPRHLAQELISFG